MNKESFVSEKFNLDLKRPEGCKTVSYSQYSTWAKCPMQWKIKYIDKVKEYTPSIHTIFGTAMHNVIQQWLQVLFNETVKKSNEMDFNLMLMNEMKSEYSNEIKKFGKSFLTKEELSEFYLDGIEILNYLRKKRKLYFDRTNHELVATEMPLIVCPDPTKPNLIFEAYLDIVLKEKNGTKFFIPDLKTSTRGWNKWDKEDEIKINQLKLYKNFLSKQYNIPIDQIEVEYVILKRKIDLDSMYPQRRVQVFKPSQGSISMNKAMKSFEQFLNECFLETGDYNLANSFKTNTGKNNSNCRFCEFKNREDLCPKLNRI